MTVLIKESSKLLINIMRIYCTLFLTQLFKLANFSENADTLFLCRWVDSSTFRGLVASGLVFAKFVFTIIFYLQIARNGKDVA